MVTATRLHYGIQEQTGKITGPIQNQLQKGFVLKAILVPSLLDVFLQTQLDQILHFKSLR